VKLLAAGTLLFFLLGCSRFMERDIRAITFKTDCGGNTVDITLDVNQGSDHTEVKGPAR